MKSLLFQTKQEKKKKQITELSFSEYSHKRIKNNVFNFQWVKFTFHFSDVSDLSLEEQTHPKGLSRPRLTQAQLSIGRFWLGFKSSWALFGPHFLQFIYH